MDILNKINKILKESYESETLDSKILDNNKNLSLEEIYYTEDGYSLAYYEIRLYKESGKFYKEYKIGDSEKIKFHTSSLLPKLQEFFNSIQSEEDFWNLKNKYTKEINRI